MAMDLKKLGPSVLGPGSGTARPGGTSHFVQLYEDEPALVASVKAFLQAGLAVGETAVVIATPEHIDAFEEALTAAGIDVDAARQRGDYVVLDAATVLERFMVEGGPDAARFAGTMGTVLDGALERAGSVRLFGEMVALLWAGGNVTGAIALEELWNDLAEKYPFRLFCAYPANGFDDDSVLQLRSVCHQHSHVIPPAR